MAPRIQEPHGRVIEVADVDEPDGHADEGDDLGELLPNSSSFCCRGVLSCSVAAIWSRIFPISVLTPVVATMPMALPAAMLVPWEGKEEAGVRQRPLVLQLTPSAVGLISSLAVTSLPDQGPLARAQGQLAPRPTEKACSSYPG